MANWPFTQGVHDIGNGCYAYLQPDGTWGWSNAGFVASEGETLLIDTLISVPLTRTMLDSLAAKVPAARTIDRLLNTHANPDHFFGNQTLPDAEIIATRTTAKGMADFDSTRLSTLSTNWRQMGESGEFLFETMGKRFDFSGIEVRLPTRTFDSELTFTVGDKEVRCVDLGPAHTESDTIVYVPADKVVFTGDILFNEGHPIMWAGPVENWIAACQYILDLDVDVVVPGHGPVTDKEAVRNLKAYFDYVTVEVRKRYDAGLPYEEAAQDINLSEFRGWSDPERIVANTFSLYRQFGTTFDPAEGRNLFGAMGRYRKAIEAHADCGHHHTSH